MLPTGLQELPWVHRPPEAMDGSAAHWTVPFGLGPPPQHWASPKHQSPVRRQPLADWQTVAPVPGSAQTREQQFEPEEHGVPSCAHPPPPEPLTSRQRPGPPSDAEQAPPQQSAGDQQRSPTAWQL